MTIRVSKLQKKALTRIFVVVGVFLSSVVYLSAPVIAVTSISQGYITKEKISLGSIVCLENNSQDHVLPCTTTSSENILGIVISDSSSIISYTSGQESQVQVATTGMASVLVSDINGTVAQGDHITASPIKGVGMKATGNTKVIGIAQGDPVNSSNEKQSYTDAQGNNKELTLGEVPILINVAYYFKEPEKSIIPQAIQSLANAIAGKQVDTLPIIISGGIFLVTIIVVMSIIYSMVRSSIISIGRNPMSQSAVYRDVIQLSVLVMAILTVSMLSIYLILTRM